MFEIVLFDANPHVAIAMQDATMRLYPDWRNKVSVEHARYTDVAELAGNVVSPANSFGWMDGGIDAEFARLDPRVESKVQHLLATLYPMGMPVGCAASVPFHDGAADRRLIVAPTVRLPGTLTTMQAVFLATAAAVRHHREATGGRERLIIPGMGTGAAGLAPHRGALAMAHGINAALASDKYRMFSWHAQKHFEHVLLGEG